MTALLCFSAFCMGVATTVCVGIALLLGIISTGNDDTASLPVPPMARPLDCFANPDLFRAPTDRGSR